MLITTVCPSCAVRLNISSHANGKIISCVNCGHKFTVSLVADLAPVVAQGDSSSQSDSPDQPPPTRSLQWGEGMPLDQEWSDMDTSLAPGIHDSVIRRRRRDRKRVSFAVLGLLFSLASVGCLWAWLAVHVLPWVYGSAASAYLGAHVSLFGKGPMRIIGVVLNIAVLVGCVVSVILLKGLIRIELGW
jgi:hypothetical protein